MNQINRSGQKIKKLCCRRCGNLQDRSKPMCQNCGEDLMLYGDLVEVADKMSAAPESVFAPPESTPNTKSRPKKEKTPRQKSPNRRKASSGKKWLWIVLGIVAVAVLMGLLSGIDVGDAPPDETKPAESTPAQVAKDAVLPDFAAFAGDKISDSQSKLDNGVNTNIYANATGADLRTEFDQYRSLLENSYSYQLLGNAEITDGDMTAEYYAYRYTGPDTVPELPLSIAGQEQFQGSNVWVTYLYNQDGSAVAIDAVDKIAFVDNGERASTGTGTNPGSSTVPPTTMPPVSGTGTTVTGEADFSSYNRIPAGAVPDLYYWSDGRATYRGEPYHKDLHVYDYEADASLIEAYVKMLQNNGFTLVDTHVQEYKGSAYYSWGFTCDAVPNAGTIGLQFENTPCHVSLYYADNKGEYTLQVSYDLTVCDTGLRYDGSTADLRPKGTSATAGLVLLPDGSYQTSDGRLTAAVGTAMVLRGGVSYTTEANYTVDGGEEVLKVENFYRDEGIYFEAPAHSMMQGDVFTERELRRWRWVDCSTMKNLESFLWGQTILAMPRDGKWLGASYNEAVYKSQTVRVMYYDAGGIAVFYIHSAFLEGDPGEVEALCVVDMSKQSGIVENATYLKVGSTAILKYAHHEDGTAYETYDWIILEGQDKISISGTGASCDVTARAPGVATVQVTYGYSKEEPDPLTGILRTVGHSKTQQYHFIIE